MGRCNVRNSEGKRGYKCDISEAQHAPNSTCCMSSCNHAWIFLRTFGIQTMALIDDVLLTRNVSRVWDTRVTTCEICVTTCEICVTACEIFLWLVLV